MPFLRSLFASVLLCFAASAFAQPLQVNQEFPSAPDKAVGVVITEEPGGWLVFSSPSMLPVEATRINAGAGIVWEGPAGKYLVLYFPPNQPYPQPKVWIKTLGVVAPPPPDPDDPDPPDPPDPDDPATTGTVHVVVIARADDLTVDEAVAMTKLRTWSDQRQSDVSHLEFNPDADDPRVKAYVKQIPNQGDLPWVFISRMRSDEKGAVVLWSGPLPKDAAEIERRVQELLQ